MKIEYRDNTDPRLPNRKVIVIGDRIAEHSFASGAQPPYFVRVEDDDPWLTECFLNSTVAGLPSTVGALLLVLRVPQLQHVWAVRISADRQRVAFNFAFDVEEWKGEWSVAEYAQAYDQVVRHHEHEGLRFKSDEDLIYGGFSVSMPLANPALPLAEIVRVSSNQLHEAEHEVVAFLREAARAGSVVLRFDFPEPVKTACEQYLLFFGEFLRDVGVHALSSVSESAGGVLFSVTPDASDDALAKVRTALDIYLRLPSSPLSADVADIHAQKLLANVRHLESQLALARAVIHAQNASIEAQAFTIEQQRRMLSGSIIASSLTRSDREEVLDGLVSIRPLEGHGVEINLPELFRRLRRLFSK